MALIPPGFLDCVVALGQLSEDGPRWVASGFLYAHKVHEERVAVYLVSNRHVFEEQESLVVRFNRPGPKPAQPFLIKFDTLEHPVHYHPDPEVDLAVLASNVDQLTQDGGQVPAFIGEVHPATRKKLEEIGTSEGDGAFVLGFPMGLAGDERNFVIARSASIARIRDYLLGASKEILLDCLVFPGNSGGPAILKPEAFGISGTRSPDAAYLLGVVAGFLPYRDVAISPQTGNVRVVFEENSGLASIVPIQCLVDLITSLESEWGPALEKDLASGR